MFLAPVSSRLIAPYGTWPSPLPAAQVASGSLRFDHLVVDGEDVYWVEGRPAEGGRNVIVRCGRDGVLRDCTPPAFNVRTRVHEYGGAAYTVSRGTIFFSNFADQRVYRQDGDEQPVPLTSEGCFYADFSVDHARRQVLSIREDHRRSGEPENAIAAIAIDGSGDHVLASGADFYAHAVLSADGRRLAWMQWNHPDMPWDASELWVADLDDDLRLSDPRKIAGGRGESVFQPEWSPDGTLFFVSDRSGWWNLYAAKTRRHEEEATKARRHEEEATEARRHEEEEVERRTQEQQDCEALLPMEAEFGKPLWTLSQSTYCVVDDNHLATTFCEEGRWLLGILQLEPREFHRQAVLGLQPTDGVRALGRTLVLIGGSATASSCVARAEWRSRSDPRPGVDEGEHHLEILRQASDEALAVEAISKANAITFLSGSSHAPRTVHAFFYAPVHPTATAPVGERPPLIVLSHGGPTAATRDILDLRIQFWTSRGFAVLDINYTGSTGFGRAYREALNGHWGIADVEDCVAGARALVEAGHVDATRLIIRGGSAGGYTTLCALTFHTIFRAGTSQAGVSDLETLARDTHKLESRYLDSLVGPYPAEQQRYRQRSPIHFVDRLSAALLLLQGAEDQVVPPNQAELMADAARRKGLPVAYLLFAGEQHGFRKAENIARALEGELSFYAAVFGFRPADELQPLHIDNLEGHRQSPSTSSGSASSALAPSAITPSPSE